jgi:hypothetical protein
MSQSRKSNGLVLVRDLASLPLSGIQYWYNTREIASEHIVEFPLYIKVLGKFYKVQQ